MKNMKAVVGVLLVFILGALSGVVATHMFDAHRLEKNMHGGPEMREEFLVKRLSSKLDLDSQQQEQVKAIVHETHAELQQLRKQHRPQIEATLEKSQAKINRILRPDQQATFAKIIAERKERRGKE